MLKLAGFVGDYIDANSGISYYLPVVEFEDGFHIPTTENWTKADLRPLKRGDTDYVHMLVGERLRKCIHVAEGELVFVAGRRFVNNISSLPKFKETQLIGEFTWEWEEVDLPSGPSFGRYLVRLGDRTEFKKLSVVIFSQAKLGLANAFWATETPLWDEGDSYFDVARRISDIDIRSWLLLRGVYYKNIFDKDRYEATALIARTRGVYRSEDSFKRAVDEELRWYRKAGVKRPESSIFSWVLPSYVPVDDTFASGFSSLMQLWAEADKMPRSNSTVPESYGRDNVIQFPPGRRSSPREGGSARVAHA